MPTTRSRAVSIAYSLLLIKKSGSRIINSNISHPMPTQIIVLRTTRSNVRLFFFVEYLNTTRKSQSAIPEIQNPPRKCVIKSKKLNRPYQKRVNPRLWRIETATRTTNSKIKNGCLNIPMLLKFKKIIVCVSIDLLTRSEANH